MDAQELVVLGDAFRSRSGAGLWLGRTNVVLVRHGFAPSDSSHAHHICDGIPLARVCDDCRKTKLARYRPEILTGYDEGDVDEAIESEY